MGKIRITIDQLKQDFVDGKLKPGLYSTEDKYNTKVVEVYNTGFQITTYQDNGWIRVNTYDYDKTDNSWTEGELYDGRSEVKDDRLDWE